MTDAPFADLLTSDREVLFFAITPPRSTTTPERAQEVADATLRRLEGLDLDALIVYDLDDESDRVEAERPFPYLETMDAVEYLDGPLSGWHGHSIVYRCVGKYEESTLTDFLTSRESGEATVFVGASSSTKPVKTSLRRAVELRREVRPDVVLGAVAIPERHVESGAEHDRLLRKQSDGCELFVTQIVYNVSEAKDLVSDYAYACESAGVIPARVVFTLSLCGSEKTLAFLQWLGVDVPRWVRNELVQRGDTLEASYEHCLSTARELSRYCRYLGLPFGFNIESVSTRRVEIEATVHLAQEVAELLDRGGSQGPAGAAAQVHPTSAFEQR